MDGSFVICLDSSSHLDCPLIEDHVRGELHAVYTIAPLKVRPVPAVPTSCYAV